MAAVRRILIAGAEIAGLSLASALRRRRRVTPPGSAQHGSVAERRLVTFHAFVAGGVPSGTLATTTGPAWVGLTA